MERSSSPGGWKEGEAAEAPTSRQPRGRMIVGLVVVVAVLIAAVLYAVDARRDHIERLQRTHDVASQAVAQAESTLSTIPALTAADVAKLRRYGNKEHVAEAERLGIEGLSTVKEAADLDRRDELVRIADTTAYVIQDLDYSVPYLVPSGSALLDTIGRRFHGRLAESGLPPFQFVVTSVTRTREHQESLRRVNVNAAQKSSHEYGTTFDLHYGKFRFGELASLPDSTGVYQDVLEEELARAYSGFSREYETRLKALLGRTLIELQDEGKALARYERRQPVFHVTVSEDLAAPSEPAVGGGAARR